MRIIHLPVVGTAKSLLSQRLTRNLGWYGVTEVTARATRLITTIVVARVVSRGELGCAAGVLTAFELIRALTNNGIGQAVIRAGEAELPAICRAAHRLVWIACAMIATIQAFAGAILAFHGELKAGAMLASLSGVYLFMAPGLVPVFLIQRANRCKVTAGIATAQMVVDNILTGALAFGGLGSWALILPKLLVAPVWLIAVRRFETWKPVRSIAAAAPRDVLRFSLPVLGSELLNVGRLNLDNVLVGSVLGLEALGTYYFVFNAGVGLSLSLTTALCGALFPHLAASGATRREIVARFDRAMLTAILPISAIIAAQAAASLIYVPLVFGARWRDVAPLVAMLCASAVARPAADAGCQLLRACGRAGQELVTMLIVTGLYLLAFALALPGGLRPAIATIAITATLLHLAVGASARLSVGARPTALSLFA